MKILILSTAISAIFLSCNMKSDINFPSNIIQKQGKGIIKNKEFVMSFDEIKVSQSISAEVVKSDTEKVVITAPSDIIDDILVDNVDGELHIHFKPNLNISAHNVAAKIFVKDFSKISANSSASIKVKDKFTQEKTDVDVSSSASISGDLEANDLSIEVSSSASFSGNIWAVNLSSEVNSSGDINISGKTKNAEMDASSSGTLNAKNVIAENANVEASSSGTVNLSVSNQITASANSSGDINITRKGNLTNVNKKESSGGSVSIQ